MSQRENSYADVMALRVGAALAGVDARQLWRDCLNISGGEYLPFDSIVTAFAGLEEMSLTIWNLAVMAINRRLLGQGIAPLFRPRVIDEVDLADG
jgi:hypothetical protein